MKDLGPLNILRLPLQVLWEFPDIASKINNESSVLEQDFKQWLNKYPPDVQRNLITQLDWAIANPAYDFQSILKNVRTSNQDILSYFIFINHIFSRLINQQ